MTRAPKPRVVVPPSPEYLEWLATFDPFQVYTVALIDPPWRFETYSPKGRSRAAERNYAGADTMSDEEITCLGFQPIMARDSVVFLWTTIPILHRAMHVLEDWGYPYKTMIPWIKRNRDGSPWMGTGHIFRNSAEVLLMGRRGKGLPRVGKNVAGVIDAPRREPSRKPDEQWSKIEALYGSDQRCIELFARYYRPRFFPVGREIDGQDIRDALKTLEGGIAAGLHSAA